MEDIAVAAGVSRRLLYTLSHQGPSALGPSGSRCVQLRQVVVTAEAPTVRDRVEAALVAWHRLFSGRVCHWC